MSIIDTSEIGAQQCRPNKGKGSQSTQNSEAVWNVKTGPDGKRKSTYGYKTHVNVDEDCFNKLTDSTAGNVHDSNCFTELVDADSTHANEQHEKWLKKRRVENHIITRAYGSNPLTEQDKQFNQLHFGARSTVGQVFSVMKLHYGMVKAGCME